eukprot:CAMPEP_0174853660 /NCGR_PEP_ID=MMETSP1114-20130205/29399_1 /TAXON_ID=312471 /ORGANISM="Neobodo designis, Strain CCAP 1951/1" /LENGTH=74 /DNA_ID=CAMNT_0016088321 /DNA_START=38 /DNA_END=259 /DNA_ORIENTATION=+
MAAQLEDDYRPLTAATAGLPQPPSPNWKPVRPMVLPDPPKSEWFVSSSSALPGISAMAPGSAPSATGAVSSAGA